MWNMAKSIRSNAKLRMAQKITHYSAVRDSAPLSTKQAASAVHSQRPFVVAVKEVDDKARQPNIAVITEGWTLELTCHASGKEHVTLDLAIEESHITAVDVVQLADGYSIQKPKLSIHKQRTFEIAKLGEPIVVSLAGD